MDVRYFFIGEVYRVMVDVPKLQHQDPVWKVFQYLKDDIVIKFHE
jgi:hypothetical protein